MRYRKLESHRPRNRAGIFTFFLSFCPLLCGEYVFNWDSQVNAIRVLVSLGNLREAEEGGKVLLSGFEKGQAVPLLELLGEICLRDERYRQAADYYLRANKLATDEKEILRYMIIAADAYYRNGDYDLAAAIYDERYRRDGDEEVLFRYGCALLHGEKFEKLAGIVFRNERLRARLDWNCATYWNRRGKFERSLGYLEGWIRRDIGDVKYHYFYAQMQYRLGRINEAFEAIRLGKIIGHYGLTAETIPLWALQMRLDWEYGNFEGAQRVEQALREQGRMELGKILLWKVRGLQKLGHRAMAWEVLKELGERDQGLAECVGGEICFEEGNFSKSLEHFKMAGNLGGRIGQVARYMEGKAEAYLGNFRKAAVIYEQLLNGIAMEGKAERRGDVQIFLENALQRTYLAMAQSIER